jgi:hypothetical protein
MRRVELPGAVAFVSGETSLLVDCPEGSAKAWLAAGLNPKGPTALCFTSGDWPRIAGLYGLLGHFALERDRPLQLLVDMREQQVEQLAGAFMRSNPALLSVEADWPGSPLKVGTLRLRSRAEGEGLVWNVNGHQVQPQ